MSETEVKACPFCGSSTAPREANADELEPGCGYLSDNECVVCDIHKGGCGAMSGYRETKAQAVAQWNTRATDAENQRLRDALENHINELAEQMGKIVIAYDDRGKVDFATKDQRFIVLNGLYTSLLNAIDINPEGGAE